jgi:hypothetical protein
MNALSPYQRYAGIQMYDSGSGTLSNLLWDGEGDYFFLSGSNVNGKIITGPDGQTNLSSNYIPKATAGYKLGNSLIYDNGTNVAIGTTSPAQKLDVIGNIRCVPVSSAWAEGLSFSMPDTSSWGGLRWRRERANADGNHYIGYVGTDTTDDLVFGSNNAGTQIDNNIRITKAGLVGVGTTVPSTKFHVFGNAEVGDSTADTGLIVRHGSGAAQYGRIRFYSTSTNISTIHSFPTAWNSGTFLNASAGAINLQGSNGVTFGSWNSVDVAFAQGGNNYFKGSVGIGNASPNAKLDVNGNAIVTGSLTTTSTIVARNYIMATDTLYIQKGVGGYQSYITAEQTAAGTGNSFKFWNSGTATLMTIGYDGSVGIGTTSPAYKLEVYSGAKTSAFTGLSISNFNNYDGTAASLVTSQLRFAILENDTGTYNAPARTFAILESGNEANNSSGDGFFAISTRFNAVVAQKFRITAAGNVGIGTISPTALLELSSSTAASLLNVKGAGGNGILFVSGSGAVGIGTTLPTTPLHVVGVISGSSFSGAGTGLTGTASSLTAGTVTTNANLSGDVTSVGNTTTIASNAVTTTKIADANVTNAKLANNSITIGSTAVSLGSTATTIAGLSSVTSTTFVGALTGTATTASYANGLNAANTYTVSQLVTTGKLEAGGNVIAGGQFSGAGTGLTGTAVNLTAGTATNSTQLGGYDSTRFLGSRLSNIAGFDFNNLTGSDIISTGASSWTGTTNNPTSSYSYGTIVNFATPAYSTGLVQTYWPDNDNAGFYFRQRWGPNAWTGRVWQQVLTNGNYNTYAPSLTGANASGTWSISISGNAATATTASYANALNAANSYTGVNFIATGFLQSNSGNIKSDTSFGLLTTTNGAQAVSVKGILIGSSYDTTPGTNEIRTTNNTSLYLNARGTGDIQFQTADSLKMMLLNNGNVGIGTSVPGRKLDVEGIVRTRGASGTGGFEISAATTGTAKWRIEWDSASDSLDFNWVG